jgi:predicted dehydrogenase
MLNIGIVGCGYWGPNLIRNFRALSDCTMKIVCDQNAERLQYIQSLYPDVNITNDFNVLLKDPTLDAIGIATPVRMHHEMGMASIEAGKHTFIEKPMAQSAAQCRQLILAAKAKNVKLMVGHTFTYSTPVRKIKEIYQSGELGEIQYISCRRLNLGLFQKDINVTWDLAPHDISIIIKVLDDSPISVNCQGKAHIDPLIEDVTNMTLNFNNGGFAIIQSSWLDPNKVREITFVGTKKMLVYDDVEPNEKIKIYDKRVEKPPHYDTFAEFQYSYHYGDMHAPYLKQVEPLRAECSHFIECIRMDMESETSGTDGLKVVEILEAASRSLKDGGKAVLIRDLD